MFVCLFTVNAKTTAQIDAKRSEITQNDPESVLCGLKSPVLVLSGRYRDISGFSFAADRHFYLSHFHFRLLPRRLTQSAFAKRRRQRPASLLIIRQTKKTFTSQTKMLCLCVVFGGRVLRCPRVGDRTMNNNESTTQTQYTLLVNSYKNSKTKRDQSYICTNL